MPSEQLGHVFTLSPFCEQCGLLKVDHGDNDDILEPSGLQIAIDHIFRLEYGVNHATNQYHGVAAAVLGYAEEFRKRGWQWDAEQTPTVWNLRAAPAVATGEQLSPATAEARNYSGELWLDEDGTANFKFHIEGGGFTEARHALERFIACLQIRLNSAEQCPFSERVENRCNQCGENFYYSYESDICPVCFSRQPTAVAPSGAGGDGLLHLPCGHPRYMRAATGYHFCNEYPEGLLVVSKPTPASQPVAGRCVKCRYNAASKHDGFCLELVGMGTTAENCGCQCEFEPPCVLCHHAGPWTYEGQCTAEVGSSGDGLELCGCECKFSVPAPTECRHGAPDERTCGLCRRDSAPVPVPPPSANDPAYDGWQMGMRMDGPVPAAAEGELDGNERGVLNVLAGQYHRRNHDVAMLECKSWPCGILIEAAARAGGEVGAGDHYHDPTKPCSVCGDGG